jgi:hypothetical protein
MKRQTQLFAVLFSIFLFTVTIHAQEAENPILVVSSQKVKMTDMEAMGKMMEENFSPILNGLVDEGMLYSWGTFSHTWGDEWNMNVWYTVKDMATFDMFWKEYMKRVKDQQAEAWVKMRDYIQEHKDNIYTITSQYPVPQR